MSGALSVLNVGAGDIALTFNQFNDAEAVQARKILEDMQARGYAILVTTEDGTYARATSFDKHGRYIISIAQDAPLPPGAEEVTAPKPKRGRRRVAVPMTRARATGVARSAGG